MKLPCGACGRVHHSQMARAVNRFTGNHIFRADYPGAPLRNTRAKAVLDMCTHWQKENQ